VSVNWDRVSRREWYEEFRELINTNVRVASGNTVQWSIMCLASGVGASVEIAHVRLKSVCDAGGASWEIFSMQQEIGKE
jgi:hypothetical protein